MKNVFRTLIIILVVINVFLLYAVHQLYGQVVALANANEQLSTVCNEMVEHVHTMATRITDVSKTVTENTQRLQVTSRGGGRSMEFEATAYTLGGNTATGFPLYGLSREEAMVIAVDPDIIPLGSEVYLEFEEPWEHYNGHYIASDTGGAIDGHIIDVFVGHGNDEEAMSFGRRTVTVHFS